MSTYLAWHAFDGHYKRLLEWHQTPYQRLMASEHIELKQKEQLKAAYEKLNPFELKASLEAKLKSILEIPLRFDLVINYFEPHFLVKHEQELIELFKDKKLISRLTANSIKYEMVIA